MTVNVITLGCSKNLVDSEHLLAHFRNAGYRVLHDDYTSQSDLVIINTCGFILDAKQESIDTVLAFLEEKRRGNTGRVFVMGCLSERYREELMREMPEVDGFFGVWELPSILRAAGTPADQSLLTGRVITTPSHYAYLKIAEGCNRTCSFCAIPGIRGAQQSVPVQRLVEEASGLAGQGVKELILVAQDLTSYGTDLYRKRVLPELLRQLVALQGIDWIRLHYAYPAAFPEEVIGLMAAERKICNYIDIPIQHVNDTLLKRMGRGHDRSKLVSLLERFRERVPDVAVRTTVMTGFPGETEEAFGELLEFIRQYRFDRLGVFPYSHEEDTPAYRQFEDHVPAPVKERRTRAIMELQESISLEKNRDRVGKDTEVLIDRREGEFYVGRTQYDSPEVDNEILIRDEKTLEPGQFVTVRIERADAFDLYGRPLT